MKGLQHKGSTTREIIQKSPMILEAAARIAGVTASPRNEDWVRGHLTGRANGAQSQRSAGSWVDQLTARSQRGDLSQEDQNLVQQVAHSD